VGGKLTLRILALPGSSVFEPQQEACEARRHTVHPNCRSLNHPFFSIGLFANRLALIGVFVMLAAQSLFTYAPVMNSLFHTAPIGVGS
jgi:hypothetical protein